MTWKISPLLVSVEQSTAEQREQQQPRRRVRQRRTTRDGQDIFAVTFFDGDKPKWVLLDSSVVGDRFFCCATKGERCSGGSSVTVGNIGCTEPIQLMHMVESSKDAPLKEGKIIAGGGCPFEDGVSRVFSLAFFVSMPYTLREWYPAIPQENRLARGRRQKGSKLWGRAPAQGELKLSFATGECVDVRELVPP